MTVAELQAALHRHLPMSDDLRAGFEAVVERGYRRLKTQKILFCGLARDTATTVGSLLQQLQELAGVASRLQCVVYENDSADGTPDLLNQLAADHEWLTVLSEKRNETRWPKRRLPERTIAVAKYRNNYWDYVKVTHADYDTVVVLDFDVQVLEPMGLLHTLGCDGWDAVGSFGLQAVPDWQAPLRFRNVDGWAWRDLHHAQAHPHGDSRVQYRPVRRGGTLMPVLSAFGGMAVYRMPVFLAAPYRGGECEHALFHADQRSKGHARFYVNPNQIVAVT